MMGTRIEWGAFRQRSETVLRAIVHEIRAERVTFLAGSVAYNAFLSLLPLLLLLLAAVGSVGSQSLEEALVAIVQAAITPEASDVLVQELEQPSLGISVLGVAILIWGALRIFRSLDTAFSDIYDTQTRNTLTDQIADGIVVFATLIVLVFGLLWIESWVELGTTSTIGWLLSRGIILGFLAVALLPMYYLFPDETDMRLREAVPGAVVAAIGLALLQTAFGIYLEFGGPDAQNGVLASVMVLLLWLYFAALVVLCAAAVNAVLTNRSEQVHIRPVIGASSGTSRSPTQERIPAEDIARLRRELTETTSLSIRTDTGEITLPPPDRVDADIDVSPLPFVNDTAHVTLHWRPDHESTGGS